MNTWMHFEQARYSILDLKFQEFFSYLYHEHWVTTYNLFKFVIKFKQVYLFIFATCIKP